MGNPTFRAETDAVDGVALRVGIHPCLAAIHSVDACIPARSGPPTLWIISRDAAAPWGEGWAVEHRDNLGWHHDGMGHLFPFDIPDPPAAALNTSVKYIRAAKVHPGIESQHGAVEDNGAAVQQHALQRHPPGRTEQRAVHGAYVVSMDNALSGRPWCRWST